MTVQEYIGHADSIVSQHFTRYSKLHKNVGVLLSGGIDSSVITTYVQSFFPDSIIFSMGTARTKDRAFVDLFCTTYKTTYEWVELSDEHIRRVLPDVKRLITENGVEPSPMQISLAAGYYLIFERAHERGISAIVTGQGPDILFAGYHKYKSLPPEKVNAEIEKDLPLLETDKKRDGAMARRFGITLLNPYLEDDFVKFSVTVPAELKLKSGVEKYCMREWGKVRGLPSDIVARPKKAFQYSTGIQQVVIKIIGGTAATAGSAHT